MARGRSVIDVLIIGDAKRLVGAFDTVDKSLGGVLKSAAKIAVGAKIVSEGFGFLQDSLGEADRLGDALSRLQGQLGTDLTQKLDKTAAGFVKLGQSRQDILEMEARFADLTTAVGLTDDSIAAFAPQAAAAASALTLLKGGDAATQMDLIAKAAGGSAKAAKELGVSLLDTKDPATQLTNILQQLSPTVDTVTGSSGDLEQKQKELGARIETLQGQLGEKLAPALADVLGFLNDEIDAIPGAIEGFQKLGTVIVGFAQTIAAPLGNINDLLGGIGDAFANLDRGVRSLNAGNTANSEGTAAATIRRFRERNGLSGTMGAP